LFRLSELSRSFGRLRSQRRPTDRNCRIDEVIIHAQRPEKTRQALTRNLFSKFSSRFNTSTVGAVAIIIESLYRAQIMQRKTCSLVVDMSNGLYYYYLRLMEKTPMSDRTRIQVHSLKLNARDTQTVGPIL